MPHSEYFGKYKIFFWSNENGEPVHVHVSYRKSPKCNSKIMITSDGKCFVKHNKLRIPSKDLKLILLFIESHHDEIESEWLKHLGYIKYEF